LATIWKYSFRFGGLSPAALCALEFYLLELFESSVSSRAARNSEAV
jgi:hypothetical protein